jgi:hypothetical protein
LEKSACTTSGVPLNGTWVTLMSAAAISFSVLRCVPLPSPAWPKLIAPGFALAWLMRSISDLCGEASGTTSTLGAIDSGTMSTKSLAVS